MTKTHRTTAIHRLAAIPMLLAFMHPDATAQQLIDAGINSPVYSLTDVNGVNLTSNKPTAHIEDVSIGSNDVPLKHSTSTHYDVPYNTAVGFSDSYLGKIDVALMFNPSPNCVGMNASHDVYVNGSADRMCGMAGGSFISQRSSGATMVTNTDGSKTYTQRDGTKFVFGVNSAPAWLLSQIIRPDGRITSITYKPGTIPSGTTIYRIQSVTRNDGLQLKYTYGSNAPPPNAGMNAWRQIASVRAVNNAIDYCDPLADSCSFTQNWPVATYSWTTSGSLKYFTITDAGGRQTRFTTGIPVLTGGQYSTGFMNYPSDQLLAIRYPTSTSADNVTYNWCAYAGEFYCMAQGVKGVTSNGFTWTYSATAGQGGVSVFYQMTATRPDGGTQQTTIQVGNSAQGPMMSFGGLTPQSFQFEANIANRLQHVLSADGDKLTYAYDGRSNITSETHTPVSGSGLTPRVRTANYDATCANPITCNKPNYIVDPKGNRQDYLWDPTHGGLLKVTLPANAFGVRAQTRYGYTARYAWYKNSTGAVVIATSPIWLLTSEKFCRKTDALSNGSGCAGGASDEVTTTYDYGPTSGPNNLFLRGTAVTSEGVTLRTCFGYDIYGNRISETEPKAGLTSCP